MIHEPRIKSEDSHDTVIEPDGKVVYIPKKKATDKTLTETEYLAECNCDDPRKHRRASQ